MPGFKSHYLFGREALSRFAPNQYEQYLIRYPQAFHLGLQGPDVFFYYLPAWLAYDKNIGNVIHESKTNEFFDALIKSRNKLIKKEHRLIADAYIAGFIGHYTLDSYVHPYIYYRTKNKMHADRKLYDFGTHVFLETDIDNALLRHFLHMKPSDFKMGDTIKMSVTEHSVISILLYRAIKEAFPESKTLLYVIRHSIAAMTIEANLMKDKTGRKKVLLRTIERSVFGHAVISPMVPNDNVVRYKDPCNLAHKKWANPWDESKKTTDSVYDLIDKASKEFEERIHYYSNSQTISRELSSQEKEENYNKLFESLGNLSFLTGLPNN